MKTNGRVIVRKHLLHISVDFLWDCAKHHETSLDFIMGWARKCWLIDIECFLDLKDGVQNEFKHGHVALCRSIAKILGAGEEKNCLSESRRAERWVRPAAGIPGSWTSTPAQGVTDAHHHSRRYLSLVLYGPSLSKVLASLLSEKLHYAFRQDLLQFSFPSLPRPFARRACSSSATPRFMFAARHVHTQCLSAVFGVECVCVARWRPARVCLSFFLNAGGSRYKAAG